MLVVIVRLILLKEFLWHLWFSVYFLLVEKIPKMLPGVEVQGALPPAAARQNLSLLM
jgi:hypothetical protein